MPLQPRTLGLIGFGAVATHFVSHSLMDLGDLVKEVLLWNYKYENNAAAEQDVKIKKLKEQLGKRQIAVRLTSLFEEFFCNSDVIIDAAKAYAPASLERLARNLAEGKAESPISCENDWNAYQARQVVGSRIAERTTFEQQWEESRRLLNVITTVHNTFPLGVRLLTEGPFNILMMRERATAINKIIEKGYRALPTYLMVSNEPCTNSSVLASLCPEMTSHLLAVTSVDTQRLDELLNTEYQILKERVGIAHVPLQVSVTGFHDTYGTIPVIYPHHESDKDAFGKLLTLVNYKQMYQFLKEHVRNYIKNYHSAPEQKALSLEQLTQGLTRITVSALQSREQALTLYPTETLCNGYFQPLGNEGKGFFVVGGHRFRNGQPQGEEVSISHPPAEKFIHEEKMGTINAMRELLLAVNQSQKLTFPANHKPTGLQVNLEQQCFVALGREVIKFSPQRCETLLLPPHHYRSVQVLEIDHVRYLAAGHRQAIELLNLNTGEHRTISCQQPTRRGFQKVAILESTEMIYASHSDLGIVKIPIAVLLKGDYLLQDADVILPKTNGHVRLKQKDGEVYGSCDQEVFLLAPQRKKCFELPLSITALEIDQKHQVIVGTRERAVYRNGEQILKPGRELSTYIHKIQACTIDGNEELLLGISTRNSPHGAVYRLRDELEVFVDGGLGSSIRDFTFSGGRLHQLLSQGVVWADQQYQLEKDGRCFCIYGGY